MKFSLLLILFGISISTNAQNTLLIHEKDGEVSSFTTASIDSMTFCNSAGANKYEVFESICKPIEFNGKTILGFGDSITYGTYSPDYGCDPTVSYLYQFSQMVGANLINRGWVGSTLAKDATNKCGCITERIIEDTNKADIIWIAGGTNDYQVQLPIGEFGDNNIQTVYGALKTICEYLKKNRPDAVVIFMTPIPFTEAHSKYNQTIPLNAYREAICKMAAAYGYNVVNGNDLGLSHKKGGYGNMMISDRDGCHPTIEGHKLMARSLCGKLK